MKRFAKRTLWFTLAALLLVVWLWTLGAAYYMAGGPRSGLGTPVAAGFVLGTALVLLLARRRALWCLLGAWAIGLVWILTVCPSNDREWPEELARTPSATFDGDRVTIRNIRDFRYRSPEDFDARYYDKTFDLGKLNSADLVICYWDGNTAIAHTMLSFGFEGQDYVCLSVETRKEKGEVWGGLPGIYKQFEVIYILGDERDLINLRTSYRKEDVYVYRIRIEPPLIRQYFELVLRRINKLDREPEFYDTLGYNCSSALTHMSAELWPDRPRVTGLKSLLNGYADEYAYLNGNLSTDLPFDKLKRRSYIAPVGQRCRDAPDFSQKIRERLP